MDGPTFAGILLQDSAPISRTAKGLLLRAETVLAAYAAYAQRVRYRLIPSVF